MQASCGRTLLTALGRAGCRVLLLAAAHAAAAPIPVEDFYRRSQITGYQLSPDGKHLAALAPFRERRNIVVIDLATRAAMPVTGERDSDITSFVWANDERLLFFMDKDGNESYGIFAVNRDGSRPRVLIPPVESQVRRGSFTVYTAVLISLMEQDPQRVLVGVSRLDRGATVLDVEALDIYTGRRNGVERNPGNVVGWVADRDGFVFSATAIEGGKVRILYRDSPVASLEVAQEFRVGEPGWSPVFRSGDGARAYVLSQIGPDGQPRDRAGLYRWNPATHRVGELVFEHPGVDVAAPIVSDVADDVIGAAYIDTAPEMWFRVSAWRDLLAGLEKAFPDKVLAITSITRNERLAILRVSASNDPGTYYLLNRDTGKVEELSKDRPWLPREALAKTRPIEFTARDGLAVPGYLTLPRGGGERLPLVLVPHGGPSARDVYGFDPTVQLLANHGYAVLQVNFRGSTGYGLAFQKAGWRQWGLKMQDDLSDAVRWAIDRRIADPARICVFGASYGGYAAMAGLVFTPELYRCGINYVGVTDIRLLLESIPSSWHAMRSALELQIGDPDADRSLLEDRSPVNHVRRIRAPLLMALWKPRPASGVEARHQPRKTTQEAQHGIRADHQEGRRARVREIREPGGIREAYCRLPGRTLKAG